MLSSFRSGLRQLNARLVFARTAGAAPQRDPRFAAVTEEDLAFFRRALGEAAVITEPDALAPLNRDWMGKFHGQGTVALKPKTTAEVSRVLAHCNARRLAVVPQGGNTVLVGGSVPVFDEVIVSTAAMNQILSFNAVSGSLVCQAGCVLEALNQYVGERGYTMPLDLGAKGSCHIGGNVATNAGGLRLLRWGSLHGSVLGLEVVLPSGEILDLLRTLRKDNTGYDLKQLFIGAEGTLGIITAVSILTPPRPAFTNVAFLPCRDYATVQRLFTEARKHLSEILSAFEFLDRESLELVVEQLEGTRDPLPEAPSPFYALLETAGSSQEHDQAKLEAFLEAVMDQGLVETGLIAQDEAQAAAVWGIRERITEALVRRGATYKYDLSMPVESMYELVEQTRDLFPDRPDALVVGYGHLGDANLHLNVSTPGPEYCDAVLERIEPFVYEWTAEKQGSISAEHGLGAMKAEKITYSKPEAAVQLMGHIKALFDPRGIMNPYKVLPASVVRKSD